MCCPTAVVTQCHPNCSRSSGRDFASNRNPRSSLLVSFIKLTLPFMDDDWEIKSSHRYRLEGICKLVLAPLVHVIFLENKKITRKVIFFPTNVFKGPGAGTRFLFPGSGCAACVWHHDPRSFLDEGQGRGPECPVQDPAFAKCPEDCSNRGIACVCVCVCVGYGPQWFQNTPDSMHAYCLSGSC